MKKKILLIQPTPYDQHGQLVKKSRLYFVGLALPLLAALTPEVSKGRSGRAPSMLRSCPE